LVGLLIPSNPVEFSDVDNPDSTQDTPEPSKTRKPKEVQDVDSTSMKTASMSPEQGSVGEEISKEASHKDEEDPSKKRKVSP
jgi:hypothetical protein